MGAAAYNRGSRVVASQIGVGASVERNERAAERDQLATLRDELARVQRELIRARRCLAAERMGRAELVERLRMSESNYNFAVSILSKRAFGG